MNNPVSKRLREEWNGLPEVEVHIFSKEAAAEICYRWKMPDGRQGTGVFRAADKYLVLLEGHEARGSFAAEKLAKAIRKHATALRNVIGEGLVESFVLQNRLTAVEPPDPDAIDTENFDELWKYDWEPSEEIWPAVVAWAAEQASIEFNGPSRATSGRKVWPCVLTLVCDALEKVETRLKPTATVPNHADKSDGERLLKATDDEAKAFRDGNQWCDVRYARTLGISSKQIDRARKASCYEIQLTQRRKADAVGKPFVYLRAELNELSGAIPDEYKAQPE